MIRSLGVVMMLLASSFAYGGDVGFIEDFALSKDRPTVLKQLIPGTDDFYYYHGLYFLNIEQFDKAEALLKPWSERHGNTPRLVEIQTRHALLTYERDPKKTLEYVRNKLGLGFYHQKEVVGAAPNLPTKLDPKTIARETLRVNSLSNLQNLNNFEDSSLDWLSTTDLSPDNRRILLSRLTRPDVKNLVALIDADLRHVNSGGFGSLPIHSQLTLVQLEELLKLRPELVNQINFIYAVIARLHPGADDDWKKDRKVALAYLERLQAFVLKLAPAHNALKAHVLYHRLAFDRAQGTYDRARFLAYLALPRNQGYMSKDLLEKEDSRRYPADLNADYTSITLLPRIGSDEPLVRSYLKDFFVEAASAKEFEPFINDLYLKHLFAETKIENGLGDGEQWASQLPPELFRQLKDRIDIDFAYTNKTDFAAEEAVKLDLHVKNVTSLLVKVFEINTGNVYRTTLKEIDTDINLDGLVANSEKVTPYSDPPLRRLARSFAFPELTKPGVYVIDFIGSGKSSRALIRKGQLRALAKSGNAGIDLAIIDEANRTVPYAKAWLNGTEYLSSKEGVVKIPFSTNPGRRPVVISRGDFSSLDTFDHKAEAYQLTAGFHIDRESLISQRIAPLLVRASLQLNGIPISVKLIEEVKLTMSAIDMNNIPTTMNVPNFKLFEDRESVHEFRVPARLSRLTFTLSAKVKGLTQTLPIELNASQTFAINEIDRTDKIEDLHFAKFGANYVIELLGRTGEPKVDRPVQLAIKHRDFRNPVNATLKTDANGHVQLGTLTDIVQITASGPEGTAHTWPLLSDRHTYRQLIHAKAGDVVSVPYLGKLNEPTREELALFEVQGNTIRADQFESIAIQNGTIELRKLAPGDYDLYLKTSGEKIRIRMVSGELQNGHVLGAMRHLEVAALKAVQIRDIVADAENVTIRLIDYSKFTRVHVYATRYHPEFSPFADFSRVRGTEPSGVYPGRAESVYLTGRNIGDEYRYVLDRRGMKKYAGNMLDRPQLLLNPWAIRSTDTGEQLAAGGEMFGAKGVAPGNMPAPAAPAMAKSLQDRAAVGPAGAFANLDFLMDSSAAVVNLLPDANGVIVVKRKEIGPHAMIHVVAIDPINTTYRSVSLPEMPASFVDLRLLAGLDPTKHFTQQKQVTVLAVGQAFTLQDVAGSRFENYDSLAKVYSLYSTLVPDPKVAEFAFVLTWPKLKIDEKRALYSKFASHELNFFISKKDLEFFNTVVKPYIANKKDKTFVDHYLLDRDLNSYLQPWEYSRLNTVERVLLGMRTPGESPKTARHLQDLLRLLPKQLERDLYLFDAAVVNGAMDSNSEFAGMKGRSGATKQVELRAGGGNMGDAGNGAGGPVAAASVPAKPGERGESLRRQRDGTANRDKKQEAAKDGLADGENDKTMKKLDEMEVEYFEIDEARKSIRALYRKVDPTMEWAENNYYHLPIRLQIADLVHVNSFWYDYAIHDGKSPFLSKSFPDASRNFTEMMFALSVFDLPFEAGKHEMKFDAGKMNLVPASPMIAFHEEVRPTNGNGGGVPILVSQNFYRNGDRYRDENGERLDKFVTGEFVVHTVYGCQLVVTNPSSSRQKLTVLLQLPVGAIPLANGQFTKTVAVDLEPYRTQTVDYFFYFPKPGQFAHFPVHVAKGETFVIAAPVATFNVVEKPTKLDTTSWDYVSQNGTNEDVIAFLNRENVSALNLDKIAFRMKERNFYETIVKLLHARHLYHSTLWSYGILHADLPTAKQYLMHADALLNMCGGPLISPLVTIDPVTRHQYEHLEYKPLVNARAHALGQRRQIVNDRLHQQYHAFLKTLSYRRDLDDTDRLAVTYYLLLQDRIDEALTTFATVNADKVTTRLQYDYCAAYLDLFTDEPKKARAVAIQYANHPVDKWRNAFATIASQIDEMEGKAVKVNDADNRELAQGKLAATEPSFEFTIDAGKVNLNSQNVSEVTVNYYLMDVELLFSRNPFVQQSGGQFSSIKPNLTKIVKLPVGQAKFAFDLPAEFAKRNVLIEITTAGKSRSVPYYANAMDVKVTESYGQLKATATDKPLSKVYVKVYAKLADGTVKFHKDGYTDVRGRFDYASVSTPERQPIERFAILVLSDEKGATIRESAPPQR